MVPLIVAGILGLLMLWVMPPIFSARRILSKEEHAILLWPSAKGDSAIATTFFRVKALVDAGVELDITGLASLGIAERLPKVLIWTRYLSQSAVYIGLFGALLGLQEAIVNMGGLSMSTMRDIQNFVDRVHVVLRQFGGAFWAALAGIFVTVVLFALLQYLDKKIFDVEVQLEDKIRNTLISEAGIDKKVDPAFEELRIIAKQLSEIILNARPSLEATIQDMSHTASGLREMIETATLGLGAVRDEFSEATTGLAKALTDGSQAVEDSADRLATRLSEAAADAGSQIASSASSGAEAIRTEVEFASRAQSDIVDTVKKSYSVIESMQERLDQLASSLDAADSIHRSIQSTQAELAGLTASHKEFTNSSRAAHVLANQPLLDSLTSNAEELGKLAAAMQASMRDQRNFLTELSGHAAATVDLIGKEKVAAVVQEAFAPVSHQLALQLGSVAELKEELILLQVSIQAISSLGDQQEDSSLLERLDLLHKQLESSMYNDRLDKITEDLHSLKQDVKEVEARVNKPAFGRIFGKKA